MSQETKPSEEQSIPESTAPKQAAEEDIEQIAYNVKDFVSGKSILVEDVEGKEISQVYIQRGERTTIYNIYGKWPERSVSASEVAPTPQRIGDLTLNPLPQSEINRTSATYEPLCNHHQALERLRMHHFIILYGEPGTGKRTAAIRLLTEFFKCNLVDNIIYELNPSLRLSEIRVDDIPDRAGLFLESGDGRTLEGFQRFHLNALLNRLQASDKTNALILVLEQPPLFFTAEHRELLQPWRLEWKEPVAGTQSKVLIKHFVHASRNYPDGQSLQKEDFEALVQSELVQAVLQQSFRPAQLAQLTQLLLRVLLEDSNLETVLAQFNARVDEDVANWFQSSQDPELAALLSAVAVFNGLPYGFIREAAQNLLNILIPEQNRGPREENRQKDGTTPPVNPFASSATIDTRLKAIHAHQELVTRTSHFGDFQERVVKLDSESWQPAVLRYLWHMDGMQDPLLSWLMPYGTSSNHAIRTRAAAAIGALAIEDFGFIEATVLRDWAASLHPHTRRSAAQVLGITIWDERHSGATAGLLHFWATQRDNWRWKWTATAAYAGSAGDRLPHQTLNDLKAIAEECVERPQLLDPFFHAILNYYGTNKAAPEQRLTLLQALQTWSARPSVRQKRKETFSLRRTALLGFLYLLMPDKFDPVWRLALQDIYENETYCKIACTLLDRAINFSQPKGSVRDGLHPREMGLKLLRRLIVFAGKENDPETYSHLEIFLSSYRKTIDGSPHDLKRVRLKTEHWEDAYEAAPELIAILTK